MILLYNNKFPKNRGLELEPSPFGMEGWFKVELLRKLPNGGEIIVRELPWQKNIITDVGLNEVAVGAAQLSVAGNPLHYIAVGTGSTTPASTDTALVAETGVRTLNNGSIADSFLWGASNAYYEMTRVRLFVEAESNGNLTEFGFFGTATAGKLFSRQLFKDSGGTPTTIVKTSSDQLRITYKFRVYPPTVDTTGNIVISGTNYTWTGRACGVGTFGWQNLLNAVGDFDGSSIFAGPAFSSAFETQTLGARTDGGPAGTPTSPSTQVVTPYVNGNFFLDITEKWEPGTANYATGIGSTVFGNFFQTSWSPKFSKDNTKRLTLVTRISWARH
jgi:hypothetical protein